jgi:hypothetical protein
VRETGRRLNNTALEEARPCSFGETPQVLVVMVDREITVIRASSAARGPCGAVTGLDRHDHVRGLKPSLQCLDNQADRTRRRNLLHPSVR